MSAPNTDPDKEERRHEPALTALRLSIVAGAALLVGLLVMGFMGGEAPEGADVRIDARTGDEIEVSEQHARGIDLPTLAVQ